MPPCRQARLCDMDLDATFRGIFLLVFLSSFLISGYHRKRARQSGEVIPRRAEGPIALLLRMAMALVVAVSFFAYVFAPTWLVWSTWNLPIWLRSAAAAMAIACLPAIHWVFVSLGDNVSETILTKSTHQLVTHGPYRWIRHPLYAGRIIGASLSGPSRQQLVPALVSVYWGCCLPPAYHPEGRS